MTIVNQPHVAGWRDGQLYLVAHPPLAEEARRWVKRLKPMEKVVAKKAAAPGAVDWGKARAVAHEARGIPFPVSTDSPDITEILGSAPRVPSHPSWVPAGETDG